MTKPIIGIDLGTTNSLVSVFENGEARLIPNRLGGFLTPSVVSVEDDHFHLGQAAKERLASHPNQTVSAFKRHMGTDHKYEIGRKYKFDAIELSSLILKKLKEDAEEHLGQAVSDVVISVPAYFNPAYFN